MHPTDAFAHTPVPPAMRLPGYVIVFVLALLLASTSPVGTGAGVHQFDLLHPLFSHVHLVNGRLLSHEQMASVSHEQTPNNALGISVGNGGTSDEAGIGLSPDIPTHLAAGIPPIRGMWASAKSRIPRGRIEAPPDPPPL
jgi:hypothetical protein